MLIIRVSIAENKGEERRISALQDAILITGHVIPLPFFLREWCPGGFPGVMITPLTRGETVNNTYIASALMI